MENPTPRYANSWCRAAWRSSPFSGSADGAQGLPPDVRRCSWSRRFGGYLNGQGISGGIPEYAFAQQHGVEVNGQSAAAAGKLGQLT